MHVSSSLPLHIARAYGAGGPARPRPAAPPLVGGKVDRPVDFDTATGATAPGALTLYNRAADRIEAAVAIRVGGTIDVRG